MKLTRLMLRNFLGIRQADVDLSAAPLHIFLGPNNSGKSSVCDAVEYALSGLARTLLVKKDAGNFLSRKGCDDMAVDLFWEGGQLRRTPSGCSLAERDIESIFGPSGQVRASLSGFRFLSQPARDRRELVAGVTGKKADIGTALTKVCKAAGLPADLTEKLVKMADEDIDHAETFAVEQRKAAKRSLDAYAEGGPAPAKVTIGAKEFDLTTTSREAVEARLKQRKAEHDAALRAEGTASLLDTPDIIKAKIDALEKDIVSLPAAAAVSKAASEAAKAMSDMTAAEVTLGKAEGALEASRKNTAAIDALGNHAKCPTCRHPIDQNFVAKLYDEAVEDGQKCADAVEQANKDLNRIRKAHEDAVSAWKQATAAAGKAAHMETQLKDLRADLAESESYLKLVEQSKILSGAVALGEKLLDAVSRYEAGKVRVKQEADTKQAVEVWDKVAKALGPNGDIRKMTAAGFDLSIPQDAALKLIGRPLEVDESWNISVGGILAPGCSRSERLRLGAGFATAFSVASKLGIVVIDEADILQASNRKALTGWLLGHADKVGTFILGSTRDGKPEAGSPDPRVKMWWCEAGEVVGL